MNRTTIARKIISSKYYYPNRLAKMDRECAYYIDLVKTASNSILREAFAKMVWIYHRRYTFYLKKCTDNGHRTSIQAGA